jgi:YD repeat-containing protein
VNPDGGVFTYQYDSVNRITTLVDPDVKVITFQYDVAGRRTTMLDANGSKRQYTYDTADRLTTQIELNASNVPIITMIDTYDNVGNRTGRTKDDVVTTWTYDNGYRVLEQQTAGGFATFAYDNAGNITSKWHQGANPMTMTFDAANRITTMLQGAALTTSTYDANGNFTSENAAGVRTTYTYDKENRLTNVNAAGSLSTYSYDGDGLRRSLQEPGGNLTTIIWDGDTYLMEKSAGGTVLYVSFAGEQLAEKRSGARRFYVPDPLGSIVAVLNTSQSQIETYEYWPYGEVRATTGTPSIPFRFVGGLGYYYDSAKRMYVSCPMKTSPCKESFETFASNIPSSFVVRHRHAGTAAEIVSQPVSGCRP